MEKCVRMNVKTDAIMIIVILYKNHGIFLLLLLLLLRALERIPFLVSIHHSSPDEYDRLSRQN